MKGRKRVCRTRFRIWQVDITLRVWCFMRNSGPQTPTPTLPPTNMKKIEHTLLQYRVASVNIYGIHMYWLIEYSLRNTVFMSGI